MCATKYENTRVSWLLKLNVLSAVDETGVPVPTADTISSIQDKAMKFFSGSVLWSSITKQTCWVLW